MQITVFTPTYNRAPLLHRLYESLCRQSYTDFEWVIVDDGSSDDTREVVARFERNPENSFPIRYFYKENGGKHTAINRGVKEAKGELFFILDSDDSLPEEALAQVAEHYKEIKDDETFGGVCGFMAHHDGTVIGKGRSDGVTVMSSIEMRYRHHITGDMCEVFRTAVLKEFPFPEIEGERFCPEQLIWFRIAQLYKLKLFRDVVYYRDYLDGGLTDRIVKIRMHSPIASMMTYAEMTRFPGVPLQQKVKAAVNYWRFRLCREDNSLPPMTDMVWNSMPTLRWWWNAVMPLGWMMHRRDKKHF